LILWVDDWPKFEDERSTIETIGTCISLEDRGNPFDGSSL
jgi:hypothetical protein